MDLLKTILGSVWMVDDMTRQSFLPLSLQLIKGESINLGDPNRDIRPYSVWQRNDVRYYNYNDAPKGSVAVFPLIGTITKYGGYYSSGMESFMKKISDADSHKNISAHLLEFDSGGGQATNIETVARFVRNEIKKPVVAWFNGSLGSAAYYIAVGADEIYSSEPTDITGSVGTLISYVDFSEYYKANGIKVHEIYAVQSTEKNNEFHEADKGNYKPLQETILNPYAQRFIDTVKEFRPQLTEASAFKGKIFMSPKAIEIGMIDGQKTWEEAAARAAELGKIYNSSNQNTTMDLTRINGAIGATLEVHDGGVFLTEAQLEQIERRVSGENTQTVEQSTLNTIGAGIKAVQETMKGLSAKTTALETKVTGLESKITDLETEVEVIGGEEGAKPTGIAAKKDAKPATAEGSLDAAYDKDVNEMIVAADRWDTPFSGSDL